MGYSAGELAERHVVGVAVCPGDMNRGRRVSFGVDLGDHEVPLRVVTVVVDQGMCADRLGVPRLRDTATRADDAIGQ